MLYSWLYPHVYLFNTQDRLSPSCHPLIAYLHYTTVQRKSQIICCEKSNFIHRRTVVRQKRSIFRAIYRTNVILIIPSKSPKTDLSYTRHQRKIHDS